MAGKGPDAFWLQGNEGRIGVGEHDAEGVLRYFQLWLPRVNQRYTELVHSQKKKELERQRQELQRRVEEEEKRKRILEKLKI